jgi:acyl dehydratase
MPIFFEDLVVGERHDLGSFTFTPESIVAYARDYDPQPFHLSDEAAAKTHFGRLCASGWHTACIYMKLLVQDRQALAAAKQARGEPIARMGGSPGFTDLKWLKPVYAGDTISYAHTVTDKRTSASRPEWGILFFINEAWNQNGEKVFEFRGSAFAERREKA